MRKLKYDELYKYYLKYKLAHAHERLEIYKTLKELDFKFMRTSFELSKLILTNEIEATQGILTALFSIGIEGFKQDPRDSIAILSLLNRSAEEVGLDLNNFIKRDIQIFDETSQIRLKNWINRDHKEIQVFGFKEICDEDGNLIDYDLNGVIFNS
jgi:hypothetical protein